MQRVLDVVERVGNRVPHPVIIFVILIGIVIVLSHLFYMLGLSVSYQRINPETHEVEDITTVTRSLLTVDGIRFMFTGVVQNFMSFNAVGVIIVAMVGVGVAEEKGLIKALIRKLVVVAPPRLLTYIMVFVGILSSIAADAGYLVLIPLAAAAFISIGRHPLAGLAAAFAAVAAAFLVNVLIVPVDGILTEITNDAIRLVNPAVSIDLAANVWFSIASVIMLTIVIALITERIVEPRLGPYTGDYVLGDESTLSADEYRGLRFALHGLLGVIAFILLLTLPPGAPLRDPATGAIVGNTPFMSSLIVSIALLFLVCGICYGLGAGTMKNVNDVVNAMTKAIAGLSGLILLLLVISQFIAYFNYSNMATLAPRSRSPTS
jgi:aminobenzoyl-glutamate transport protein